MATYFINSNKLLKSLIVIIYLKKKMIIKPYKIVGCNMDIMLQSACLVANPITVYARRCVRPQTQ